MSKKKTTIFSVSVLALVILIGAGWKYHEQPRFCADTCHIMDPYLASWKSSDYGSGIHAEEGVDCLECHEPTIQEQVSELITYVKGDYKTPLSSRYPDNQDCFGCHVENEHTSYEQVKARTTDYVIDGQTINPHDAHENPEYPGDLECYRCHKMHRKSVLINGCYSAPCHHTGDFQSCTDAECHGEGTDATSAPSP